MTDNPYAAPCSTRPARHARPWAPLSRFIVAGLLWSVLQLYFGATGAHAHDEAVIYGFVASLFVQGFGVAQHFIRGELVRTGIGLALVAGCLVCGSMPWYGEHPDITGLVRHRHSIWELGHIH